MAIEMDNLHYSFRAVDGYNKPFNFVIGPREPGKTTSMWMEKIYSKWKKNHNPWIVLVRYAVSIDEAFIDTIFDTNINKFTDDNVKPIYNKGAFKGGIVDVFINVKTSVSKDGEPTYTKILFFRIVSLNIKMDRIKRAVLKNCAGVFMDEFIINPKFGEKYLQMEYHKIREAYTTWRREADGVLKLYFCGNPYSLFNPYFVGFKVNISKLKRDSFYVGDDFVIHWCILKPELRDYLLEVNPFFKFDEDYANYALDGQAVNDNNIKLGKIPKNFELNFVVKVEDKYIGIFKNRYIDILQDQYYVKFVTEISVSRTIYCFEFTEMVERSILISIDERMKLQRFKEAVRRRLVSFEDINVYYYVEEIYKNI